MHPRLRRRVELQVLEEGDQSKDPGPNLAKRLNFLQTARKAAAIRHVNVEMGVLEAATCGSVTFVAREHSGFAPVDGFGPRDRSQRQQEPLYPNWALAQALLEGARGLAEIHRAGLHHGHITPAVLRRGSQGQVCITGLEIDPANPLPQGAIPEAITREAVHKDIFDLGKSFTQMVCGNAPQQDGPRGALADRLRRLNPGLSYGLARILDRCLTADTALRFRDAQELVRQVEEQTKFEIVPASWKDRRRTHLLDAFILIVPVLGANEVLLFAGILRSGLWNIVASSACAIIAYVLPETLLGWTPGRRLRGLCLLDAAGERPGSGRLLVRFLFRLAWLLVFAFVLVQFASVLLGLLEQEKLAQLERFLKSFSWFGTIVIIPLLAMGGLYLTSLFTPDRRPLHDYLTGVSWYQRRTKEEASVLQAVETARAGLFGESSAIAPSPADGQPLGRMDQYELRALLGQGGMGAVYEAWDTLLERRIAIKVLTSSVSVTPAVLQRFEREARLAAQLSHPNVAQVLGVGEAGGQPYMVMEFVDGENLQQLVQRKGHLPLARAWEYTRQTALALREAARHGIVHRDIKPANLMLAENDVVKVTDFGISRAFGDEEEKTVFSAGMAPSPGDASLTKTGALLGTPMYLSPEQARGEKLDQRSDIYSLGMTLYFLVSGRPPFEGGDIYDLVTRQCTEEPPSLGGKVAEWTPERDAVLRSMIAKDCAARFQDYDDLLEKLNAETLQAVQAGRVLAARLGADSGHSSGHLHCTEPGASDCKSLVRPAFEIKPICARPNHLALRVDRRRVCDWHRPMGDDTWQTERRSQSNQTRQGAGRLWACIYPPARFQPFAFRNIVLVDPDACCARR